MSGGMLLLVQVKFSQAAKCRCSSKRNFRERQNAVSRQSEIPANGRVPLLVKVKFPPAAERRCLSK